MNISIVVRTCVSYILIGCLILVFGIPWILIALLPAQYRYSNRLLFFLITIFYRAVIKATLLPYYVYMYNNTTISREPAIIVANHQSSLDIPLVGAQLNGMPHIWFVLEYYAHMPLLGFLVRRLNIPIDVSTSRNAARGLLQGIKISQKYQLHVIIFPEGGRYVEESTHEFFKGFALLARTMQRPVIPIYMPNNGKIYPPGSFLVHRYPIKVVIGPSFWYQNSDAQLVEQVKSWFKQMEQKYQ